MINMFFFTFYRVALDLIYAMHPPESPLVQKNGWSIQSTLGRAQKRTRAPVYFILYCFDIHFDVALVLHLHKMLCLIKPALRNFFIHTAF